MISPIGHNMHHQYGEKNACNFAPIFKIWDRAFGTLNSAEPFWWESDRKAASERIQGKKDGGSGAAAAAVVVATAADRGDGMWSAVMMLAENVENVVWAGMGVGVVAWVARTWYINVI